MTDEQLLEYRRVKLLERDEQISKLIVVNIKLREKLREDLREGISLRDHFAGLAMQALMNATPKYCIMLIAIDAYKMADGMLAEREKEHDH